jgi:hypothetical protein
MKVISIVDYASRWVAICVLAVTVVVLAPRCAFAYDALFKNLRIHVKVYSKHAKPSEFDGESDITVTILPLRAGGRTIYTITTASVDSESGCMIDRRIIDVKQVFELNKKYKKMFNCNHEYLHIVSRMWVSSNSVYSHDTEGMQKLTVTSEFWEGSGKNFAQFVDDDKISFSVKFRGSDCIVENAGKYHYQNFGGYVTHEKIVSFDRLCKLNEDGL